jgi:hypothetical protein
MIYREITIKDTVLLEGDIFKECKLINCSNLDAVHLEKCDIITIEAETVLKKKTKKCLPCEKKKLVEDANE